MSLDRSLKTANALVRHRNVLTRGERLEKLKETGKVGRGQEPDGPAQGRRTARRR